MSIASHVLLAALKKSTCPGRSGSPPVARKHSHVEPSAEDSESYRGHGSHEEKSSPLKISNGESSGV